MAFEAEHLETTRADLRARGVTFTIPGTGELGTFFNDSEGNLIEIAQPTRQDSPPG